MEDKIKQQQEIISYCLMALDYVRNCDPNLFKKAKEYAEDQTGVEINDFQMRDTIDDDIEDDDIEDDNLFRFGIGDDDED